MTSYVLFTPSFRTHTGKLSAGGDHGKLVAWVPCGNVSCAIFDARVSPQTPFDSSKGVADGGVWMASYITGLYRDQLPNEMMVVIDFYHLGMRQNILKKVKFAATKDSLIVLPRGKYRGTYQAAGYSNFDIFFEVSETDFEREDLTLDPPFFIPALSQGEVRMVMTWDYDCTGDSGEFRPHRCHV
jgi:hypothetical protein